MNLKSVLGYAELIEKAAPDFVEAKSYMWVGYSRKRLAMENMPLHGEIKAFAEGLARETGYKIIDGSESGRVVLLKNKKGR